MTNIAVFWLKIVFAAIIILSIASFLPLYAQQTNSTLADVVVNHIVSTFSPKPNKLIALKAKQTTDNLQQQAVTAKPPLKVKTIWFDAPGTINLFKSNYLLPFYYTFSPYKQVYQGKIPGNQSLKSEEVKFQISVGIPLLYIYNSRYRLSMAYTQLSYWQFYTPKSQYFRETNYEPELFVETGLSKYTTMTAGIVHQSNGRGGELERSWNRVYLETIYNDDTYLFDLKIWDIIFRSTSSDLHNPDIGNYLGYGQLTVGYKMHNNTISMLLRSIKYPTIELNWSFPLFGVLCGYVQFFSGYGQSLLEYNHHTNAIGIGISLNNW